jgi:hypothetical protein
VRDIVIFGILAILSPRNIRFELREPDLVEVRDIRNIWKKLKWILGFWSY